MQHARGAHEIGGYVRGLCDDRELVILAGEQLLDDEVEQRLASGQSRTG